MRNTLPKQIDVEHFRIAIFGSARIKRNDPRYNQIYQLARMIAAEGIDIVTGGGPGIMEAANKGHREGRKEGKVVHSFGLTIQLPMEQVSNKHLDIKKDFARFSHRLDQFMALSNAVVVAPGGVGTMLELFYTWQLVQVKHMSSIPIILFGKPWPELIKWIEKWPLKKKFIDRDDMIPLFVAKDSSEAMKIIKLAHREHKKGNANFCCDYKEHKIN